MRVPFFCRRIPTIVIMVEQQVPLPPSKVSPCRFATPCASTSGVERPGLRQTADLVELSLIPSEQNEPIIRAVSGKLFSMGLSRFWRSYYQG